MEEIKNTNVSEENQNTEETTTETITYTVEEVNKLIQSEADRRVNQALEKQKRHYEKQLSLSTLDAEARSKAEKDMRIQELEEKLKEFNVLQTKNEVIKVLNNRGLNPQFADLIAIGEDVEEAQKRIETLDKLFKNAVQEEVKKRLNSNVPAVGADATGTITKETLKKMNAAQRTALYHSDPELYKSLISK
jgi:hypothetical protein